MFIFQSTFGRELRGDLRILSNSYVFDGFITYLIRFETMEDARNGLGMDGMVINGRKVNVAFAEGDRKSNSFEKPTFYSFSFSSWSNEGEERSRFSPSPVGKSQDDAAKSLTALFSRSCPAASSCFSHDGSKYRHGQKGSRRQGTTAK